MLFRSHSNADYTALIKWAVVDDMAIITEVQRFRRPTDEVQKAILLQMHADRPARIYVESAPHSDAMIAIINRTEGIPVRVTAVKSGGLSKEARLEKVLHHVNLGKVGMLRGAPGLPLLLQELRGCCQTNSNQSQFACNRVNLCGTKQPPFGKCLSAVQLEVLS